MHTLVLDEADLQQLVCRVGIDQLMDELIEQMRLAFLGFDATLTEVPQRTGFHYSDPTGLIEWMPLHQRGVEVLMKVVGYHPTSPARYGLPTIVSTVSVFNTSTGHLSAVVDGTLLTALRTGAASAVASELLAFPESRVLGLVGCGAQSITQLHAISRRFSLTDVLFYDTDADAMESFLARSSAAVPESVSVIAATLEEVEKTADILCTATSVEVDEGPVVRLQECRPWLHVNAVGSDLPGKVELSRDFLRQSFVCPDFLQQALIEGECQQLTREEIGPTIIEVLKTGELRNGRQSALTVFDSTGWALEDWTAVQLALEHAKRLGIGRRVKLECLSADPRNPYGFLQHRGRIDESAAMPSSPRAAAGKHEMDCLR